MLRLFDVALQTEAACLKSLWESEEDFKKIVLMFCSVIMLGVSVEFSVKLYRRTWRCYCKCQSCTGNVGRWNGVGSIPHMGIMC